MSVKNCKVAHIRPQFHDLREWMEDPANVYIGRAGVVFIDGQRFPQNASPFCNPFKVGKDGTREEVIAKFRIYMEARLAKEPQLRARFLALRGMNLGCWCAPEPCHGNVLLELLRREEH